MLWSLSLTLMLDESLLYSTYMLTVSDSTTSVSNEKQKFLSSNMKTHKRGKHLSFYHSLQPISIFSIPATTSSSTYYWTWVLPSKMDYFITSRSAGSRKDKQIINTDSTTTTDTHFTLLHISLKLELHINGKTDDFIRSSISSSTETESTPDWNPK